MKKLTAWNKAEKAKADKRKAQVRKARKRGLTWREIAAMLGVSRQRAQQLGA